MAPAIPQALSYLVGLNVDYRMLICIDIRYRYMLQPSVLAWHLHDRHKCLAALWKQAKQYVRAGSFLYDCASMLLPANRLASQPIVLVVDGFACQKCLYKTYNYSNIRKHANQVYSKKCIADKDICQAVQLQLWFGEKQKQYWIVVVGDAELYTKPRDLVLGQGSSTSSCTDNSSNAQLV